MITFLKRKQVIFSTFDLRGHYFHADKANLLYLISKILLIVCIVWKIQFSWYRSSTSEVMVILMNDDKNFELKFSQLRKHFNPSCTKPFGIRTLYQGGGQSDYLPAASKTVTPMNLKFCRVLETSLNVWEM